MSVRRFCFTWNNPHERYEDLLRDLPYRYMIYGRETGESGTFHLQGYCSLTKPVRFSTLATQFPWHIERAVGTTTQNKIYCSKQNDFVELGNDNQGHRTDLDAVRFAASEDGMRSVTSIFNAQQIRVAERFLSYNEESRDFKPEIWWLWGETGIGKSRFARDITHLHDTFTKNTATKWWCGYDAHEAVIIDDFRPSWWDFDYMLNLLDRYPFAVEFKGGQRQMLAKKMVITCIHPPGVLCRDAEWRTIDTVEEKERQLLRRLDHVIHVTDDTEVTGNTNAVTSSGTNFVDDTQIACPNEHGL